MSDTPHRAREAQDVVAELKAWIEARQLLKAWTLDPKSEIDGEYDRDFRKKAAANAAEIVDNLSAELARLAEAKANELDDTPDTDSG